METMIKNRLSAVACICALVLVSACQTSFQEFRHNFSENFKMPAFSDEAEKARGESAELVNLDGIMSCPEVRVVDDLSSLSEFTDPTNPSPGTLVSEVTMTREGGACVYNSEDRTVAVQITLDFNSRLGSRAKIYKGDKPNFAYPYFIAVTSPNGEIVAKEVFAASVSFNSDQQNLLHNETLRQIIPLKNMRQGPDYTILVGFQLTDEQLSYNRYHSNRAGAEPRSAPVNKGSSAAVLDAGHSRAKPARQPGSKPKYTMKPIMDDPRPKKKKDTSTVKNVQMPPEKPVQKATSASEPAEEITPGDLRQDDSVNMKSLLEGQGEPEEKRVAEEKTILDKDDFVRENTEEKIIEEREFPVETESAEPPPSMDLTEPLE
jgi:hypothetical protein